MALLYHLNLGFPAVQAASRLTLDGSGLIDIALPIPSCLPAGPGQARATLTSPLHPSPFATTIALDATTPPYLQLWRDPAPSTAILSIEPCTSQRLSDGRSGRKALLDPGAQREFHLEIAFAPG